MGISVKSIVIVAASLATFTAVYLLAPGKQGDKAAAVATPAAEGESGGRRLANPLEPAARGLIECHNPNEERKTCRSMATYEALGGGKYRDTTVALVSNDGPTLVEITTPVEVKSGAACVTITPSVYSQSKVLVGGRLLGASHADPVRAALTQASKRLFNKQVCTSYFSSFGELTAKTTIDGLPAQDLDSRLKWIGPDDGYTVAP